MNRFKFEIFSWMKSSILFMEFVFSFIRQGDTKWKKYQQQSNVSRNFHYNLLSPQIHRHFTQSILIFNNRHHNHHSRRHLDDQIYVNVSTCWDLLFQMSRNCTSGMESVRSFRIWNLCAVHDHRNSMFCNVNRSIGPFYYTIGICKSPVRWLGIWPDVRIDHLHIKTIDKMSNWKFVHHVRIHFVHIQCRRHRSRDKCMHAFVNCKKETKL